MSKGAVLVDSPGGDLWGCGVCGGRLAGGFVGPDSFVGFRDFRGFLDGGVDRYGAKVAKGRKEDVIFWGVSETLRRGERGARRGGLSGGRCLAQSREGAKEEGVSEFRSFGGGPIEKTLRLCGFARGLLSLDGR